LSFASLGLHESLLAPLQGQGYTTPTPIQASAIPVILAGRDVIGMAQTGTGKTAAFVLPILQRLMQGRPGGIRALIVTPTRELAEQINTTIIALSKGTGLHSATVYGGVNMAPQERALRAGVDIIVACPGRLLDHMDRGYVRLNRLQTLVLDEADRMLDMGFLPAIKRILARLPSERQTLLFSATMMPEIKTLAMSTTRNAATIQVDPALPPTTVTHAIYPVIEQQKTDLLLDLLRRTATESVLVFTRTKHRANRVAAQLDRAGYAVARLHSNRSQSQRQLALDGFRDGTFQVLVATDIAARGIDVTRISHVINYDMPDTSDAYIHRIGRTGRAARSGDAFTLMTPDDRVMLRTIERALGTPIERRNVSGFAEHEQATPVQSGGATALERQHTQSERAGGRANGAPARSYRPSPRASEQPARKPQREQRAAQPARPDQRRQKGPL
jgi:ATP-dependent RNA helicase RhlE